MPEAAIFPDPELPPSDPHAGRYVVFRLSKGEFGVAVQKVREVIEMVDITRVPSAPAFIAGVINLRGKVIPVVDLRGIFELAIEPPTARSCIVVFRAMLASTEQVLGLVVDEVMEVLYVEASDFLDSEDFGNISDAERFGPPPYLIGVTRIGGTVKLLLDIDEVLNHVDVRRGEAMPAAA